MASLHTLSSAGSDAQNVRIDLTAAALGMLSLQEQSRPGGATDSASTRDWSAMTDEDNALFSSALVADWVGTPGNFGRASGSQKLVFYQSLVVGFREL